MESSGCRWPEAHCDSEKMAGLAMELRKKGGFENYGVPFCMTVEAEALGAEVKMGDTVTEPHVVDSPFSSADEYTRLGEYDFSAGRIKTVLNAISIMKERDGSCPVIGNLTGPFSLAGSLVDMSGLLKDLRRRPDAVHSLLEKLADMQAEFGSRMAEAGADFICISEPSGTGEIMGKKRFAEFSVKYINRVLDKMPQVGTIVHICGDLSGVYDCLSDIHCDIFSVDAVVPIKNVKKYLEGKAVMGNVSTFALGSEREETVRKLSLNAMRSGADILAPACGLSTKSSLANVRAMVKTAEEFR